MWFPRGRMPVIAGTLSVLNWGPKAAPEALPPCSWPHPNCLQETGASLRCIPLAQPTSLAYGFSTCLYSGYQATEAAIFARAL